MLESLDQTILLGFTEEAQSYLPLIRQGVGSAQTDSAGEDVQLAYRHTHTIRGAAMMVGLPEISCFAERVESVLEKCIAEQTTVSHEAAAQINADLDNLEALINETIAALKAEMLNSPDAAFLSEDDFSQFADNNSGSAPTAEAYEGDDDLDPEMLEVFALEAEDLLRNISESLRRLEANAQNMEALREIRRSSHTLKGAAGVCGFRTVSRLAHRMEDLLDHLAENPASSNAETTALILSSTDVLENLTRGEHENTLRKEIDRLYASYDILLEQTASTAVHPNHSSLLDSPEESYETVNPTEPERFASPETVNFGTPAGMPQPFAQNSASATAASPQQRAVVRVGLDRLDELVKLIGEMVISRTTLEQRLAEVESQLAELHRSTARLKRIAGKLEIDYEASALAGGSASATFAPQFLASRFSPDVVEKHGFDALEFDRYTEFHQLTRELSETAGDTGSISGEMDDLVSTLEGALARQRRISEEMQEKLMRLRMVPLSSIAPRLERTVRVTAQQENKLADFAIEGEQVELDTQVLDSLAEPLLHLLRNAVGHGLESAEERLLAGKSERGLITLSARHEGTHIVLKINDDGRGINTRRLREKVVEFSIMTEETATAMPDEEAVALVFLPGLSTAKEVSEVSGRGVGMDVVRESVMRQQGTISIKSVAGQGTTVTIRLPMSLAVTRALLVKVYGERFAIPVSAISQLVQVGEEEIFTKGEGKFVRVEDEIYPVCSLNSLLNLPELPVREEPYVPLLIIKTSDEVVAVALDQTLEAREIVIKPFDALLRQIRGLLGATLLGDGSVVPILDLFALVQKAEAQMLGMPREWTAKPETLKPKKARLNVMIVDDSPSVRRVMTNLITKTGWDAMAAKDGLEALEMLQTARQLPDVILSDVEMPRMDGYELIATLKRLENFQRIPVVVITSRSGEKHRRKALDMGASEYITKPYTDSALLETVRRLGGN